MVHSVVMLGRKASSGIFCGLNGNSPVEQNPDMAFSTVAALRHVVANTCRNSFLDSLVPARCRATFSPSSVHCTGVSDFETGIDQQAATSVLCELGSTKHERCSAS